jgi:hypothetical protein
LTPSLSLLGLNVPGVNFSHPEPQKHAIFTDFDCDLWKNRAFQGKVCFLEVALKLKDLQFTFTAQVVPAGPLEDTYDSDF